MSSDDVSTSMNEGCRVVGCEASGKMTARRVHGWPTQLGEKGFFNRVKLVAIVKCNKQFFVVVNKSRRTQVWTRDTTSLHNTQRGESVDYYV